MRCRLVAIALSIPIFLLTCTASSSPPTASILRVERLTGTTSAMRKIARARIGPDGSFYLLDTRLGALVRSTAIGEDTLTPAGFIKTPTDFEWIGDTIVILDAASNRAVFFNLTGEAVRVLQLPHAFGSAAFDPEDMLVYLSVYAARYYYTAEHFVPGSDSLIEETSLSDGRILSRFGKPAQYGHAKLQFLGNDVLLARQTTTGSIAVAWPVAPQVEIRSAHGHLSYSLSYKIGFTPPPPHVLRVEPPPMPPEVEYQKIIYSMADDSMGRIFLLAASMPGRESIRAPTSDPPRQVVDILAASGHVTCRIAIPIFATSVVVGPKEQLLLSDNLRGNGAYRLFYHCPFDATSRGTS